MRTAREFITQYETEYDIELERGLQALDRYLQGVATVQYSQFPDADLPEEFLTDPDEPAGFDEFFLDLFF